MNSWIFLFIAVGGGLLLGAAYFLVKLLQYSNFPRIEAEVLSKCVHPSRGNDGYEAAISYRYNVAGATYTSSRVYSLMPLAGARSSGEKFLAKVAPESSVAICDDPRNPAFSFVANGPFTVIFLFAFIGFFFTAIPVLHLVYP